jgi:anti-anti-sigma regulatory factor
MNTLEMGQLKFFSETTGNSLVIHIEGSINEDLVIEQAAGLHHPHIIFDMQKVKMINSCGIREWIRMLEKHGPDTQFEYVNVPQIVIQQMNMISGFLTKNAKVITFYAPYFIEDLDEERQILLKSEEIKDFKAPKMTATVDGTEYELDFDAIEDQYFRFLKR